MIRKKCFAFLCHILLVSLVTQAQDLQAFELTQSWLDSIEAIAPRKPTVPVDEKKHVLIFSLHTGYEHWVIPHTEAVMRLLATTNGIARVSTSKDIAQFEAKQLDHYDAIILNNTCPDRERRNIFYDVLRTQGYPEEEALEKSLTLEGNLISFVKKGGGLMLLHGGATMQNDSQAFSEMAGGSFDFHPKQQAITVRLFDPSHPLVQAFDGQGFTHVDEPYFYKNAYTSHNFRPLLYMEADRLEGLDRKISENVRYLSWIRKHGKGRVFLAAPSHNAHSYEIPELLQFFQDGLQYVLGQLECDDAPLKTGE